MTVIAYRDGVMAADDVIWDDHNHVIGRFPKILRLSDGGLLGCNGNSSAIMRVRSWIDAGATESERPSLRPDSFGCIWVTPSGKVIRFNDDLVDQMTVAPFFTLSCKPGFTLGCLHAGASAEEAVRLTLAHTDAGGSENTVQVEYLGGARDSDVPRFLRVA